MMFVLILVPTVLFLWVVLGLDFLAQRRRHKTWNALLHQQSSFWRELEGHMLLLYVLLVWLTVDVAVLSWLTLR